MVSIGTILTLGIIGAIAAGSYAVYANSSKIGSAVSRGVDQTLVNPLGKWADSLWSGIENASTAINENISDPDPTTSKSTKFYNPSETLYTPTGKTQQEVVQDSPSLIPVKTTTTRTPAFRPSTVYKEGFYYFNFAGSQYDFQAYQTAAAAKEKSIEALRDPSDSFQNIKYLGASKLGPAGLNLFAKSQNYL